MWAWCHVCENGEWGSPRMEALIHKHRDPLLSKCNANSTCKCSYCRIHIVTWLAMYCTSTSLPFSSVTATSLPLTNLQHSTQYSWSVQAMNEYGSSPPAVSNFSTPDSGTCVWMCWWTVCVSSWWCAMSWANVALPLQSPSLTVLRWQCSVCLRWRWTYLCSPTEDRVWQITQWVGHLCSGVCLDRCTREYLLIGITCLEE